MKARLYLYVVAIALMAPFSTLAQGNGNGNGNGNNGNGSNGGGTSTSCAALPTLPILIRSAIVPTDVGQDIFYTNETGAVKLKFVMAGYTYRISNCGIGVEDTYMFIIDDATGTAIACADDVCEQQSEIIFKAPVSALYTVLIKLDASGNFGDTRVPGFEIELLSDDPNYVHGGGNNGGGNPNSGPGNNNAGGNGQLQNTFWNQEGTTTTSDPELFLGTASATDMVLRTDGQNRMAITSGGDIKLFGLADQSATGPRIATIDKDGIVKGGIELDDDANAFANCRPVLPWLNSNNGSATSLCSNFQMVGIGTSTPQYTLDVVGDGAFSSSLMVGNSLFAGTDLVGIGTSSPAATLHVKQEASSNTFPDALAVFENENDDRVLIGTDLGFGAYSALTRAGDAGIFATSTGDNSTTGASGLVIGISEGGQQKGLRIDASGLVQIGDRDWELPSGNPENYKLAVKGSILAERVEVLSYNYWPDYVFKSGYELMTLEEVKAFIEENQHLPNVPSEKEVMENGTDIGEMNAILLQKIEELTLYVIELKEENKKQQEVIDELSRK